jgi:hypothetical protein
MVMLLWQEFESQENNLDSILEQFEKEQAQEFGKPRQPKPEKPPGEKKPRQKRKAKSPPPVVPEEEDVEVETLRSGRKRKVRRIMTQFIEGSDEDDRLGEKLPLYSLDLCAYCDVVTWALSVTK